MTYFRWYGDEVAADIRKGAVEGLEDATDVLLDYANQSVPIQDGILQASGDTSVDESKLTGAAFYDTPYARRQHEETHYAHPGGRRAKWLELSLNEIGEKLIETIGKGIERRT